MPYTLKPNKIYAKDKNGQYLPQNILTDDEIVAKQEKFLKDVTDSVNDAAVAKTAAQTAQSAAEQALAQAQSPVVYGAEQTLDDNQKALARSNIGAAKEADVSDLKSAVTTIENYVGEEKPEHLTLVSGAIRLSDGYEFSDKTRLRTPQPIYLEVGDKLTVNYLVQYGWVRISESGEYIEGRTAGYTNNPFNIETSGFYKFSVRLRDEQSADISGRIAEIEAKTTLVYVHPETGLFEDIADLQSQIDDIDTNVESIQDTLTNTTKRIVSDAKTTTTVQRNDLTLNIINYDGATVESSTTRHINILVVPGDVVKVERFYKNSSGVPTLITEQKIAAVCAYNGSTVVSAKGASYNANLSSYTVPEGIDNITITFLFSGTLDWAYIYKIVPNGQVDFYPVETVFKNPTRYTGSLVANKFQQIGKKVCVDEYVLSCICKIDSGFSSLKIGGSNAGESAITAPYIEVTPTQIKMYSNTDSSYNKTETHGLTISDDLQVFIIVNKDSLYARFIIQSKGARWESTGNWRFGASYYGFGVISESAITLLDASISVRDLYRPVWVCGDSWVTFFDTRWYGQAIALDIKNFLHSGHSGEGSKDGLEHLKTLLSMYTPKLVVWLYGMNDDDTNDSTPNTEWLAAFNELKTICENMTIELVLATIPTTPTRNMNAKNLVVTASGYRYVDEVAAMGADTSGNWIAGYQSSDGNHTTEAGAKALLAQVLADVPEIALK